MVLVGGTVLFSVSYFLPYNTSLQVATFLGGLIGYGFFSRIINWRIEKQLVKEFLLFFTTILMSSLASLCLLGMCYFSPDTLACSHNRFWGFTLLIYFFPLLLVFFGWISYHWSTPRK
jgi:hypothetical protein